MGRKNANTMAARLKGADPQMLARVTKATGANSPEVAQTRLEEIISILGLDPDKDPAVTVKILSALETLEAMAPRDAFERLLVNQMLGVHHATMKCLYRAGVNQSLERRDFDLKNAQKLTATYTMQLETLNKHRGKGQQKVTVEHVNVSAGGQAIVGNVDSGTVKSAAARRRRVAPPQLEHQAEVPLTVRSRERVRSKSNGQNERD